MARARIFASMGASFVLTAHIVSASAQSSGDAQSVLTRSAADLTCSDLVGMDDQGVGNVLYYVAGYTARGLTDEQASETAGGPGAGDDEAGAAEPAYALAPTGSDNTAEAAASGSNEKTTTDTGPSAALSSVGGFEIDVEQALSSCEAAPEARLTDVLDQQRAPKN